METRKDYIIAYSNNKDIITIKTTDSNDTFSIDGHHFYATLVRKEDNLNVYKLTFPYEFDKEYKIESASGLSCYLNKNLVVKESFFDDMFYYGKNDLGSTYNKKFTEFKIWAPIASKVKVKYILDNKEYIKEMTNIKKGIFYLKEKGNLENALYSYLVTNNGKEIEVNDIYSYSGNANFEKSAVINFKKINKLENYKLKKIDKINEAIIYETSIRDFTSKFEKHPTFTTFIKEGYKTKNGNMAGFDYLKELGITHVQLMPVTSISTIDDNNSKKTYNWGYDQEAYNVLEGSYSTNPNNPYSRMNEFITLVNKCHKHNIRVCLDMVYNHTYKQIDSIYNKLVPNYFYLMDEYGNLSNGSFCGNDLDYNKKMVEKYIVDMATRLVSIYGIDGIRLDLMGIMSIDSVNKIYEACKKINPSFILYGEGWNMPSMLPFEKRASLLNFYKLDNVAFFNDIFRNTIKGNDKELGYMQGNESLTHKATHVFRGSIERGFYFNDSKQSINYVDCHDNITLNDKLDNLGFDNKNKQRITLMSLASIIFSSGIPFIHSGMEFNRTKYGNENSYNLDDKINMIDWDLIDDNLMNIQALKDFISIRKSNKEFTITDRKTILNNVDEQYFDNKIIKTTIAISGKVIILIYNPFNYKKDIDLNSEFSLIANEFGFYKSVDVVDKVTMKPYSFKLLIK